MTSTTPTIGSRGGADITINGKGFNESAIVYLKEKTRLC